MHRRIEAVRTNHAWRWFLPLAAIAVFVMTRTPGHSFKVTEVSVQEAKSLVDAGALVVDVRGKAAYDKRHIPGAISAPLEELRQAVPASIHAAADESIVVYCGDGVTIGPEGTQLLNTAGYAKAVNLKAGIDGWEDAGYPVLR